ncbi:p115 like vesicle tethering protein [Phakopsora pachyrhizi]|uniref:P115 like vesicle tethering protein n=1 Tax=Phakopsora pachyrhizi TaxID=170000 RepID=A0AAV0BPF0_PHAPC|nr:p115 like vesicle tethering protein [Phakopsora pachyrhizi]KAI8461174.1 p115 like vesicle tethering protein [Phakopsora pachyrhizi]CAH7688088.1 p115 like vesicle tethering protein [Phakopsora pachyrhizi]
MSFLSSLQGTVLQGYAALQGPQGQPQSAASTLTKLVDRLQNSVQHEDKRSSVLGIKGMARDWKKDVGAVALQALLDLMCKPDAGDDVEMAKAILETLHILCEVEESDPGKVSKTDTGVANVDTFLKTPAPTHGLLALLGLPNFYLKFFSLQLLGTLLTAPPPRPQNLQSYFLTAPGGLGTILSMLDDNREIIRNEALLLLLNITEKNADIQKIIAFEGGFDRLFHIIDVEGGIGSGGIVVQDCLICVGQLLRYNISNQNYFRETSCIPHLAPMLLFPPMLEPPPDALDAFATQPWTEQKVNNALLVIALARTLVSGAGTGKIANQKAIFSSGLTRCLAEIGLASTAPEVLKSEALHTLSAVVRGSEINQDLIGKLFVSPLAISVPEEQQGSGSTGQPEESLQVYRVVPQSSILALVSLALHGPYGNRHKLSPKESELLRFRAAAVGVLEAFFAGNTDSQLKIIATMETPQPSSNPENPFELSHSPGLLLLDALRSLPLFEIGQVDSFTIFFACLIFAHLLRNSELVKQIARNVRIRNEVQEENEPSGEEDERSSLVQLIVGNLMMAQRAQSQANNSGQGSEKSAEWARVMVGYLVVLATWMWDSPHTTDELLSEGTNLQVLIEPVGQTSGVDPLVQGLCALVLGIIYETDQNPNSPIPRVTLQPILQSRIGPDQFVNRILRLREDPRFKDVGPDVLELNILISQSAEESFDSLQERLSKELWFDWPFVEFVKNNYVSIQQSILVDPASSGTKNSSNESAAQNKLIDSLRDQISEQSKTIKALEEKVEAISLESKEEIRLKSLKEEELNAQIEGLKTEMIALSKSQKESEKEQEDLLVLLEEVTSKRKRDKVLMREKGLDVSEDDDDDDDE